MATRILQMLEIIIGIGILGVLGYFGYKVIVKHETPLEAITEMKDEIVHEAKHLEEVVEHKVDDVLHSFEDQVAARAQAAEKEKIMLSAKAKYDELGADKKQS